jgi:hypothetical protein
MKKTIIIILSLVVFIAIISFAFYYFSKPDLIILSVTRDKTVDSSLCKYNVEIKNNGFAPINSIVSYCFWPEGKTKCKFLWDVLDRNSDTGVTNAINLKGGETYNFEMVPFSNKDFGETCPNTLHFCIDCNLHVVYDKEVIDGTIKEFREGNNDYTYTE